MRWNKVYGHVCVGIENHRKICTSPWFFLPWSHLIVRGFSHDSDSVFFQQPHPNIGHNKSQTPPHAWCNLSCYQSTHFWLEGAGPSISGSCRPCWGPPHYHWLYLQPSPQEPRFLSCGAKEWSPPKTLTRGWAICCTQAFIGPCQNHHWSLAWIFPPHPPWHSSQLPPTTGSFYS